MFSKCCCDKHELLQRLDETGDDDDRFKELLSECVQRRDEFALYLNACIVEADETAAESTEAFVSRLRALVNEQNPWALAELGIHFLFDHKNRKEHECGKKYTLLGALFGERRAQFYLADRLRRNEGLTPLVKRLMRSSALQGYGKAKEALADMQRSQSSSQN